MICRECGKEIADGCNVCPECGALLNEEAARAAAEAGYVPPVPAGELPPEEEFPPVEPEKELTKKERRMKELEDALDGKNRMGILSTKSIVLSWIVMSIPVVGLFFAIAWACGLCRKAQKRYLGRAFLILTLIGLFLFGVFLLVYRLIFGFTLMDLPTVLHSVFLWFSGLFGRIFTKR